MATATSPNLVFTDSHIDIRGVRLDFDDLIDERQLSKDSAMRQREILKKAEPFEHLTFKGLFNERLLELVHDEFDLAADMPWKKHVTDYEDTRRSMPGATLGPAAQLFFWLVNSAKVTQFLSTVTGVDELIPDPNLLGGGMHETRNGGHFSIHRDFEAHFTNGLNNAMVFITYLNKEWLPSYEGLLELWDDRQQQCVKKVSPDFGVSLLMCHGPRSYHGYTAPLRMPEGRTRRSVATYYYTNPKTTSVRPASTMSKFLFTTKTDVAKGALKQFVPPILWDGLKKFRR